ncbi:MAG: hypothetical protein ACTHOU_05210 [Aureliella sp.]
MRTVNGGRKVFLAVGIGLLCLGGCAGGSSENPDWPKRAKASGTVSYKGKPVEGAEVTFTNTQSKSAATGKTDGQGHFALTTFVSGDGAVPGPQIVTVRRVDVIDKTPEGVDLSAGGTAPPPEIHWIIPERFSIATKSGLTADVTEAGPNEFSFDLK